MHEHSKTIAEKDVFRRGLEEPPLFETFLNPPYTQRRMKLPKTRKTYCPKCKKHTEHKVIEGKKKGRNATHPMSFGSQKRIRHRGHLGIGNHGKYSRPPI